MLRIDPTDSKASHLQLREQLIAQIDGAHLTPGSKLPPVRKLASELGLAPNTVARTYRDLEAAGYVVTKGRGGTLVAERARDDDGAGELTEAYVRQMLSLGQGPESITNLVRQALMRLTS